jgi:hypothetical protein
MGAGIMPIEVILCKRLVVAVRARKFALVLVSFHVSP